MMKNQQDDIQTIPNDNDQTTFYTYPILRQFAGIIFTIILCGVVNLIHNNKPSQNAEGNIIVIVLLLIIFFLIPFSIFAFLWCSELGINDREISAYKFGLKIKSMKWHDVTKIKKIKVVAVYPYRKKDGFNVSIFNERSKKYSFFVNFIGPIYFSDDMFFANELLHKVEEYAEQYGIPIIEPNN